MTIEQFSYHDQLLLAQVKLAYYRADKAHFQAYNPTRFASTWEINWQAAINAAEAFMSDEDVVDMSTSISGEVDMLMQQARKLNQMRVKPFVENAFENDKGKLLLFGFEEYAAAVKTASRMVIFLKTLHTQCFAHQAQLVNIGFDNQRISQILTLHDDLSVKMIAQANFTGTRMSSAQQRREIYATMNEFTYQTCRAGKLIYDSENEAKYRSYLLPVPNTKHKESKVIEVDAKIVLSTNILVSDYYEVKNQGNTSLCLYISTSTQATMPSRVAFIAPYSSQTFAVKELGFDAHASPNALILWNKSATSKGRYSVNKVE
ncbi:MAG: hypothetical protein ACRCSB_06760 [Bacteroidales bacterium]